MNIREFFNLILSKNDGMVSVWRPQVGVAKKNGVTSSVRCKLLKKK